MKKLTTLLLSFLLCLSLTGCSTGKSSTVSSKTLQEHGMDVILLMEEMVKNDTYQKLVSESPELNNVVAPIREADYSKPKAMFQISLPEDAITNFLSSIQVDAGALSGLSETLMNSLNQKLPTTMISQINAREGAVNLAAASIYTANKMFVTNEISEDVMYLYTYESGYPVLVSFSVGEDNAVNATGTFIINSDFHGSTAQEIKKLLNETFFLTGSKVEALPL